MEETTAIAPASESSGVMFPYLDLGTSFVIGLAVGYFLKKSFKLLLLLLGLALVITFVLESQGVITLNEANLEASVAGGVDMFKHFAMFLKDRLGESTFTKGLGAVAGFFVGLKMG